MTGTIDAFVVGSGPNGLSAAIRLAQAGCRVQVLEAEASFGGGVRSAELTLPGFTHDVCSAIHPMAVVSPFFRTLPLSSHGLEWIEPPAMLAHPMDNGRAVVVDRSVDGTAAALGRDGDAYRALVGFVAREWPQLEDAVLGPPRWPRHPLTVARFGRIAVQSAFSLARSRFAGAEARALFGGIAAHGMLPLDQRLTAAFALVLGALAHVAGWVFPRAGAQRLSDALAAHLRSLGGEIVTGAPVRSLDDLPPARAVLCDLSPAPFLRIAGHRLPVSYRERLRRYRYGVGTYKVDWALAAPIPWTATGCARAGTVHLGGTIEEIARSERDAGRGTPAERPFVLLTQPTLFDPTRAPAGRHVAWAYCHVPPGSNADMLPRIEAQVERFAPGFRDRVLARCITTPAGIESHNANFVGGDIGSGVTDLRQMIARATWLRYSTPLANLYLCSASTAPGVSVHGMCGYYAAEEALRRM